MTAPAGGEPLPCPRCGSLPDLDAGLISGPRVYYSCPAVLPSGNECGIYAYSLEEWNMRAPSAGAALDHAELLADLDAIAEAGGRVPGGNDLRQVIEEAARIIRGAWVAPTPSSGGEEG